MKHFRLKVIPEPAEGTRAIIAAPTAPAIKGPDSENDAQCGQCGTALIVGIPIENIQGMVIRCPQCGAHNVTEGAERIL